MKSAIKILRDNGVDDTLCKLAEVAFKDFSKDSTTSLRRLCRGNDKLKAAVLAGVVALYGAEKLHSSCREDKNLERDFSRGLKKYFESIDRVYQIDNSIDRDRLRAKAVALLKNKLEYKRSLSRSMTAASKDHKNLIRQMVDAVKSQTTHSDNAIRGYLSDLLNSMGYKTIPKGKPFTRQNILK